MKRHIYVLRIFSSRAFRWYIFFNRPLKAKNDTNVILLTNITLQQDYRRRGYAKDRVNIALSRVKKKILLIAYLSDGSKNTIKLHHRKI